MIFATTILAFLPSVSAQAPSATSDRVATEYVTAHVLVTDLGEFDIDNQRYRVASTFGTRPSPQRQTFWRIYV